MSIHHFVSHLDQVIPHQEGYIGKRLVTFLAGAVGYAHGIFLTLPAGTKILSHWHEDREAVFYCVSGAGTFVLDDREMRVGPGDAMFVPLTSVHGFVANQNSPFHFLDFALFSTHRSVAAIDDCFAAGVDLPGTPERYGRRRALFRQETYGNPAIKFVGEYVVNPHADFSDRDVDPSSEQILLALDGVGQLEYLGESLPVSAGSIQYLIQGVPFRIENRGTAQLRLVGTSSQPGRYLEPALFQTLRNRFSPTKDRRVHETQG